MSKKVPQELPLLWRQLPMWFGRKSVYRVWNSGFCIRLEGELNPSAARKAISETINRQQTFWLSISTSQAKQHILPRGQVQVLKLDLSDDKNPELAARTHYKKWASYAFDLTEEPLVQISFIKLKDNLYELQLICPHIIFDAISKRLILDQFSKLYKANIQQHSIHLKDIKGLYEKTLIRENKELEQHAQEFLTFWTRYTQSTDLCSIKPQFLEADVKKQKSKLEIYDIPKNVVEMLLQKNQHYQTNLNSLIMACSLKSLNVLTDQQDVSFCNFENGRKHPDLFYLAGYFLQISLYKLEAVFDSSMKELTEKIEQEMIKTKRYQNGPEAMKLQYLERNKRFKSKAHSLLSSMIYKLLQKDTSKTKYPKEIYFAYAPFIASIIVRKLNQFKAQIIQFFNLSKSSPSECPPEKLMVFLNIINTPDSAQPSIEGITLSEPDYALELLNRNIGADKMIMYFVYNPSGHFKMLINGPITKEGKDKLASRFFEIIKSC